MSTTSDISGPKGNYVGLLQEKCQKNHKMLPVYEDLEDSVLPGSLKKCLCKLDTWTTEGTGFNKKEARHNAAKLMLDSVTNAWSVKPISESSSSTKSAVSKIFLYCDLNKEPKPLFSEKGMEEKLFVIECTFKDFSALGKGINKKEAKEKATDEVVKHFHIQKFIDNYEAKRKRSQEMKNPASKLSELCQSKSHTPCFSEEIVTGIKGKTVFYVVTCTVNDLVVKSNPNCSKKSAKTEAAALMVNKLKDMPNFDLPNLTITPQQSDCKVSSPEPKIDSSCEAKNKSHNFSKKVLKKLSQSKQNLPPKSVQDLSFNATQTLSSEDQECSGSYSEESANFDSDDQSEEEDDASCNDNVDHSVFQSSESEGPSENKSSDDGEPLPKRFKDVY